MKKAISKKDLQRYRKKLRQILQVLQDLNKRKKNILEMNQIKINQIECEPEVVCLHKNQVIKVLATYCTCEVTTLFCEDCGEQLTEEKWEV